MKTTITRLEQQCLESFPLEYILENPGVYIPLTEDEDASPRLDIRIVNTNDHLCLFVNLEMQQIQTLVDEDWGDTRFIEDTSRLVVTFN